MVDRPPRFGLLAILENRRAGYFRDAIDKAHVSPLIEVDWSDVLDDRSAFDALRACDLIRVDAAGEDAAVTQQLIELGGHDGPPLAHGEFRATDAVFRGMARLFDQIGDSPPWTVPPASILAIFDKWVSHERLSQVAVNRPPTRLITAADTDEQPIIDRLDSLNLGHRLFVKPRFGSSASGVCALWRHERGYRLIGPVEIGDFDPVLGRPRLYNSLRIRTYTDPGQIETILRAVVESECVVEPWLAKASLDGKGFDIRVVVINGEARHVVLRSSRHPMTNLHLGSARGDVDRFMQRYGLATWEHVRSTAETAASAFADAIVVGVDVLLDQDLTPHILEANSFGDLLPGVLSRGQSTYEAVVDAMVATATTHQEVTRVDTY